jgi:hypothetical protein
MAHVPYVRVFTGEAYSDVVVEETFWHDLRLDPPVGECINPWEHC